MILAYTSADIRAAEEPLLAAGLPLMDRAAYALATRVLGLLREQRGQVRGAAVVVIAGAGSNGGDALHAGALLARRGVAVTALLTSERAHEGGLAAFRAARGRVLRVAGGDQATGEPVWAGEAVATACAADVILDGVLGIGASGAVRGPAADVLTLLRELLADERAGGQVVAPLVVAVDTPSGIDVDSGVIPRVEPADRAERAERAERGDLRGPVLPADLTVTFGAAKAGLLLPPSSLHAGQVDVVDIGLDLSGVRPAVARLEPADIATLWPTPAPDAHKYSRGVLGVVAGTPAYPGAAVLTVCAAIRAGVGMVRYQGSPGVSATVLSTCPEVVAGDGRVQAWTLGPGIDPGDSAQAERVHAALAAVLAQEQPAVVDAGALSLVPDRLAPWVVLTPHAGELAALLSAQGEDVDRAQVEAEPLRWARRAHELTAATVLLKGPTTLVVGAGGAVYSQADAPAWLATAGAGDVLAGLLGAMLAGRSADVLADPSLVAALGAAAALVHGLAAHRANPGGPVSATAVAEAIPGTVAELLRA
ncbi:NAD(P)H-hydrate dehydratase [Cellulomonas cellasea]|uniref:bifunctional ADP-dependent NAD(P)H-hydrate dehydratase/NAD(P)H-hydrate epimerase n=1 Tax=Cellulomonas cellasea TaxID=43670 RepID=UPI0025A478CB|nr:bifunctional ADP-dependent NAD(P)H-hydrate dehydratase/NAD(P)H-hydrate epimerase [Cellulomonas cellasea]MDM8085678.1 NAD(P)H-hydrate dehydratase [Cellulomonas cellasea]